MIVPSTATVSALANDPAIPDASEGLPDSHIAALPAVFMAADYKWELDGVWSNRSASASPLRSSTPPSPTPDVSAPTAACQPPGRSNPRGLPTTARSDRARPVQALTRLGLMHRPAFDGRAQPHARPSLQLAGDRSGRDDLRYADPGFLARSAVCCGCAANRYELRISMARRPRIGGSNIAPCRLGRRRQRQRSMRGLQAAGSERAVKSPISCAGTAAPIRPPTRPR